MKYLLNNALLSVFLIIHSFAFSQNTVGLLYSDFNTSEGYTLFSPEKNTSVYLINNCGEIINEWTFTENPGATCYLLDNGNLLRAGKDSLQIRDWNNNVVWTYAMNENALLQHHDIEPLPNGNILCLITDKYTAAEIAAEGRDPNNVAANFKLDKIVELEPVGINNANIVWEWKFIDHFVQDFDNTKPNFGIVVNSPELIDLNYDNGFNNDYTHVNSVDYNVNLDQIMLSARHLSEIYIIDHSTTTAEATSHTGGNSNMGGDILWRWGNPQVYDQGTIADQNLFRQHDAKWVQSGNLDDGKISVFNNDGDGSAIFSSIHLIEPEINNNIYTKTAGKFNPLNFDWSWNGSFLGSLVYESKKSGVQSLPNGNMLICESSKGNISEITKTGNELWVYKNPTGNTIYNQFQTILNSDNGIFRAEKYPNNFIGFSGQNLTPQGIIENQNDSSDDCILTTKIEELTNHNTSIVNPSRNGVLQFNKFVFYDKIIISDINGRKALKKDNFSGTQLNMNLSSGMYYVHLIQDKTKEILKIIVE